MEERLDIRRCVDRCYAQITTRPDRPPNALLLDRLLQDAQRMVRETEGLERWMRRNGFDPDEPTDILLVARLLVTESSEVGEPA